MEDRRWGQRLPVDEQHLFDRSRSRLHARLRGALVEQSDLRGPRMDRNEHDDHDHGRLELHGDDLLASADLELRPCDPAEA